jgi:NAD-dependent DNA ligase
VVGEDAGSKLDKARTLGIRIIDEAELRRLAGES